mgnify:CR=1 FL=1
MPSAVAAFFDLDHTVLSASSTSLWAHYQRRKGRLSRWQMARLAWWTVRYKLAMIDMAAVVRLFVADMAGQSEAELIAQCDAWFNEMVAPRIAPRARERIAEHRAQGHTVALLTAASPYVTAPVAANLGLGDSYICTRMEVVARSTYQRGLGAGFVDDELTRQRLALFARRGQMRVLLLELDGMPSAYWLGVVYGETFHAFATGYIPEAATYEVGTLSFLRLVEELVREGVGRLDFGLGDAYYKERFADRSWREATVQLFARTFRGRVLRGYLGTTARLDDYTRRVVKRLGLFDRVKGLWQARLRSREH